MEKEGDSNEDIVSYSSAVPMNNTRFNFTQDLTEFLTVGVWTIFIGSLLTFFALFTVAGNLLVIAAICRERQLRTVTNFFILSLTIADLVIGLVVMPFGIFLELSAGRWIFGAEWCDLWHSLDVLASTASILNLTVVSLDRYWAITDPIAYPGKMTTGRGVALIGAVWTCSAAISFPAISWWRSVETPPIHPGECLFTEDPGYLIFSSVVSFYLPMSVILFAYFRIYRAATIQTRSLITGSKVLTSASGCKNKNKNKTKTEVVALRVHRGGYHGTHTDPSSGGKAGSLSVHRRQQQDSAVVAYSSWTGPGAGGGKTGFTTRSLHQRWTSFALRKKLTQLAREQKAAKTLGIVVGVFCVCWVPFFVANLFYGLCHRKCVPRPEVLFPVVTWLGYINSGMNPVIYAYSMREFRRAFLKIVFCIGCGKRRRERRATSFRSQTETSLTN